MDNARAEILEGLNVFRALEAWGATLYAAWAAAEPDARLRAGHLIIAEREANHARLLARVCVRRVNHMHDQIRFRDFFERRAERGDELRRQFLNEPHGVGEQRLRAAWQFHAPRRRVECGKQLVFH